MSSQIIDEMIVKVGVDTSEYDDQVGKLAESNDKLTEGLEDTEKQFEKTTKTSRENSKEVKNANDEYSKFTTNLGSTLSLLAKIGTTAVGAGLGFGAFAANTAKVNNNLQMTAKNINEMPNTLKKFEYTANALGLDGNSTKASIEKIKAELNKGAVSGDQNIFRFFQEIGVDTVDRVTGKARKIEGILFDTAEKMRGKTRSDAYTYAMDTGLNEDLFNLLAFGRNKLESTYQDQNNRFMPTPQDYSNYSEFANTLGEVENKFKSINEMLVSRLTPTLNDLLLTFDTWLEGLEKDPEKAEKVATVATVAGGALTVAGLSALTKKMFGKGGGASGVIWKSALAKTGVVVGAGYIDHSPELAEGKKRNAPQYQSYIDEFKEKYGVEGIREAYKLQGPTGIHFGDGLLGSIFGESWEGADVKWLATYLKKYEKSLDIESKYGNELPQEAYSKNRSYFSSYNWKSGDPDKVEKWIEELLQERSGKDKDSPEKAKFLLGGASDAVSREISEGNILAKETNEILKRQDNSHVIRSIEESLIKLLSHVIPEEPTDPRYLELRDQARGLALGLDGGDITEREKAAIDFFMSKGWSKNQAIGIVANLKAESGLNSRALNPNEQDSKGNKFSSKGIAQWNRERLDKFREIIGRDISQSSYEEQLKFVQWELENTHRKAFNLLKQARTSDEAVAVITKHFEIPADMARQIVKRQAIADNIKARDPELKKENSLAWTHYANSIGQPVNNNTTSNSSSVDVSIGDVIVHTSADSLSGVGSDVTDAVRARYNLGQLTTGMG